MKNPEVKIKDEGDGRTRLRVQFDITYKGSKGVVVEGESMTVPDMTLTLQQLLERHSRGRDIPMKEPLYFETELPTLTDITDVEKYRDQLKQRLEDVNRFIDEEAAEKQREAASKSRGKEESSSDTEEKDQPTV